ncbi:MAG: RNA polymerase sigma factor [Bacteroidales bacterium]|nr:MAG: RNA polymerase sigma factor [Bacteroidales bacterium]
MITDNELMLMVKSGDIDRLGLIFERHNKPLYGYFLNLTGKTDISEDLVQNVFMRILKYRTNYRGDGNFNIWIYRIAHNVFVDFIKRKKKLEFSDNLNEWDNVLTDTSHEEESSKNEKINILESALMKLPQKKREILTLSRYKELKYKEISRILGCSESAVKVRIFRAMEELKNIYNELSKN